MEVFGDQTETYFQEKTSITLTEAALSDETILQKLIAAVGQDKFPLYFDVKQHVAPTEALHQGRATNPELAEKAQKLMDDGVLKPYKAAVKQG